MSDLVPLALPTADVAVSVVVVPYAEDWPVRFVREAARLEAALAPWLVGAVEHVGSTAVPGLAAKPVLDMLAPVADLREAREALPVLEELGYRHADHRPHEALWCYEQTGDDDRTRRSQLHLTRPDSALWRERVVFRDALRADAGLLAEYQQLKRSLAAGTGDLATYTGGKRAFVAAVLARHGVALQPQPASPAGADGHRTERGTQDGSTP